MRMVELGTVISPAKVKRCGTDKYPVLSMTMHDGLVFQSDKFKKEIASRDRSDYKVVLRNQLVISFPIDEGVLAAQRIADAGIVSPAYGIWDIDQQHVLPEYLEFALRSHRAVIYYKAKLRGSTARRRSLPTPTLLAFTIPLPNIAQQQSYLEAIHKAQSILMARRQQLVELDNLVKARFVEMFGDPIANDNHWTTSTLEKVLECGSSVSYGIVQTGDDVKDGIPVFRPVDIAGGNIPQKETLKRTEKAISEKYKRTLLKGYELLITVRGSVGETFQVTNEFRECNVGRNIVPLRFNTGIVLYPFMQHLFATSAAKKWLDGITKGIALRGLNMGEFKEMPIIIPPLEQQMQFAEFSAQVDKSKLLELYCLRIIRRLSNYLHE